MISDLHLGARGGGAVLERPEPLAELCARLSGARRLVLLGDVVELRHGPARDALARAEPVLQALGEVIGEGGEIVLVPGNHDHGLLSSWLRDRGLRTDPPPLALDELAGPRATPLIARVVRALQPAAVTVRYPGAWLRDDVYAMHGHYLDCLSTLPAFERLGAGLMARIEGPVPASAAVPDDFEARLAPMYAWLDAMAESRGGRWSRERAGASAAVWQRLSGSGRTRPLRARAIAAAFPLGVRGLNRAGLGPLRADISGEALRDAGLAAMHDAATRLGVGAPYVLFGHTHRAGPLAQDDPAPWRRGPRLLLNGGSWLDEARVRGRDPSAPYWPGRAIEVPESGSPRVVRLVEDLGRPAPRPAAAR